MKKFLQTGLLMVMAIAAAFPMQAKVSGNCGQRVNWELEDGVLSIKGTGEMYDYYTFSSIYSSYPGWYDFKDDIINVVIEEGVTTVGNYAFEGYSNLESVSFPEGLIRIGSYSFAGCTSLASVSFPESLQEIGANYVTNINQRGFSFQSCISLKSITLPENVKKLGWSVFADCMGLETVYWNAIAVEENTRGTTTSQNYNFSGSAVRKVVFGPKVKFIPRQEFYEAGSLSEVVTSGSIEYVGDQAFGKTEWENNLPMHEVCYIDHAAYLFKDPNSILENFEINFKEGTTCITDYLMQGARRLSKITVPETVYLVGNDAFKDCAALSEVEWNATQIVEGEYNGIRDYNAKQLFSSALLNITFGETVNMLPDYFLTECSGLSELNLPSSLVTIGEYAFRGCLGLTTLTIPDNVETLGRYAIYECDDLEELTVGEGLKNYDLSYTFSENLKTVIWNAVRCDGKTTSIGSPVETFITGDKVELVPANIFSRSNTLSNVVLSNSVKEIGEQAFGYCSNLKSINLPESLEIISKYAFRDGALEWILIPSNVKEIDIWAYFNNPSVQFSIITPLEVPTGGGLYGADTQPMYVSYPELYKTTAPWSGYYQYIEPMATADIDEFESDQTNPAVEFECNIPGYSMEVLSMDMDMTPGEHTIFVKALFESETDMPTFEAQFAYTYHVGDAGVDSLLQDSDSIIDIYTLDGLRIRKGCNAEELQSLPKGLYIISNGKNSYKVSI